MKKVLHLRIDSPGFNSNAIEKGFLECGYEYHSINWQLERFNNSIEYVRSLVIKKATELSPDWIFCHLQNSEIFSRETWVELSKIGFVINYSFDVRSAEKMQWMYEVAKVIGFTFFACAEDVNNCISSGINNVAHIHSSCDMDLYKSKEGKAYNVFDVVFCGNKYDNSNLEFPLAKERQEMIAALENKYEGRFACYGLGQKGGLIQPSVEATIYTHSKIAISQNNFFLDEYTSDRLWRIMASGTFCLAKYFPGIERMFKQSGHLVWFNSEYKMFQALDYYLNPKNEQERLWIAAEGQKLVREKHSWKNRIEEMEKIIAESK